MTKPIDPKSIEAKTKIPWAQWMDWLDSAGARQWSHKRIAQYVNERIDDPWWAQQITICYEEQTGKRKPGQRADGSFSFSISKTIDQPRTSLLDQWIEFCETDTEIKPLLGEDARRSDTPNRSVWRVTLKPAIKFIASTEPRGETRAALILSEDNIPSETLKDENRNQWRQRLNRFAAFQS